MPPKFKRGEGQKFSLVHRSQTDYTLEDNPSPYVLVPIENGNDIRRREGRSEAGSVYSRFTQSSRVSRATTKDHVNYLGFANDGYDYEQHFREPSMGGTFIGRDGKVQAQQIPKTRIESMLPDEVFASQDVEVEAITISANVMDADLHAALFDENAEEEFEELDDDFVAQALGEDIEEVDPEFEIHVAELIQKSEKELFNEQPRVKFGGRSAAAGAADDDEVYSEDDGFMGSDIGIEDFDGEEAPQLSAEDQEAYNAAFERTLNEEYAEEDIGGLSDEDIEGGSIDLDDFDEMLDQAMDEFIEENPDEYNAVINKTALMKLDSHNAKVEKQKAQQKADNTKISAKEDRSQTKQLLSDANFVKSSVAEQNLVQLEAELKIEEIEQTEKSGIIGEEMKKNLPYLTEEKVVEEWDCESILSTYSTAENHPTVIRAPSSKFKAHKSKFMLAFEAANANKQKTLENTENLLKMDKLRVTNTDTSASVPQIILGGKLGLPQGFEPGKKSMKKQEAESDEDSGDDDEETVVDTSIGRPKNESKEEKALRKKMVKEAKREKRELKKATKNAFADENKKLAAQNSGSGEINRIPVFRY